MTRSERSSRELLLFMAISADELELNGEPADKSGGEVT
jgi:hypothetical protein